MALRRIKSWSTSGHDEISLEDSLLHQVKMVAKHTVPVLFESTRREMATRNHALQLRKIQAGCEVTIIEETLFSVYNLAILLPARYMQRWFMVLKPAAYITLTHRLCQSAIVPVPVLLLPLPLFPLPFLPPFSSSPCSLPSPPSSPYPHISSSSLSPHSSNGINGESCSEGDGGTKGTARQKLTSRVDMGNRDGETAACVPSNPLLASKSYQGLKNPPLVLIHPPPHPPSSTSANSYWEMPSVHLYLALSFGASAVLPLSSHNFQNCTCRLYHCDR